MSYRFADRVPSWSCSQAVSKPVWHTQLLCVEWKTPDDGQRNCPNYVGFHSKNKCQKLVHLVVFIIRIYHDVRSPERQIHPVMSAVPLFLQFSFRLFRLLDRIRTELRPDPARKPSANLYDTYHCCVYSEKLLMMDRRTVRNRQSFIQKINLRNSASAWFYYKNWKIKPENSDRSCGRKVGVKFQ